MAWIFYGSIQKYTIWYSWILRFVNCRSFSFSVTRFTFVITILFSKRTWSKKDLTFAQDFGKILHCKPAIQIGGHQAFIKGIFTKQIKAGEAAMLEISVVSSQLMTMAITLNTGCPKSVTPSLVVIYCYFYFPKKFTNFSNIGFHK